jgi:hypothetical protein
MAKENMSTKKTPSGSPNMGFVMKPALLTHQNKTAQQNVSTGPF